MLNVGRVSVTKIFVTRDSEAKSRAWLHSGWASRAGLLSHMNIYINIYKDINARLTQRHHNQSGLSEKESGVFTAGRTRSPLAPHGFVRVSPRV
jgi:hypothetical protein